MLYYTMLYYSMVLQNAASSAGSVNSSSATLGSGGLRSGGSIQGGRRPIIIRDDQQRVMLQSIRDSLAHLQKASPHSPGSDASGRSCFKLTFRRS